MARLSHCRRCAADVRTLDPWPYWRPVFRAWMLGLVPILMVFPFFAGDMFCSLPSFMLYLTSGGLIYGFAKQRKVCRRCSLELS
ncbi:MAG: hypothetical protein AB8I08_29905 [Sandaracinaceae bacterium]